MKKWISLIAIGMLLWGASAVLGANDADTQTQLQSLQQRVAELETQLNQQTYQQRNAEMMREMLKELSAAPTSQAADTGLTAGYDKRFFIKSTDDQFSLQLDTLFQFKHSYMLSDDGDKKRDQEGLAGGDRLDSDASAFELERARLYLTGHVLKDLNYKVIWEGDSDRGEEGEYLYWYELSYSFMPELGVRLGKYKGPFGKQEPTSAGRLMFIDRSLANEVFNIDRNVGVGLFGTVDLGDIKPYWEMMVFNGFRDNENAPFSGNDNTPSLAARMVTPLMGASREDFLNESDLEYHENMVAQVGCSFAYTNDRAEDNFAGGESNSYTYLGKSDYDCKADVFQLGGEAVLFGADVAMKYQGLSVILEGFYQHIDGDSDEFSDASDFGTIRNGIDGLELDNYGWYAQAGYFLVPKSFELVGRVGGVCVDSTNDSYEYAGGWNWYLYGQDLKLSMDVTYIDDLPIVSSSPNFNGIQNNSLFLVRTQLQFQF